MSQPTENIRVAIQQPALPSYRVPVFHALAQRPGIDLTVYYGNRSSSPTSVSDVPFNAKSIDLREWHLAGRPIMWHSPQVRLAAKKHCDTLVLSWDLHYVSLIPALLRAKANGVRTVLWGHGYSKQEAGWRSKARGNVARLADALLFYNHSAASRYIEAGWDPSRIYVALNAIDQSPVQTARQQWLARPDDLTAFRREHELDNGPVILFVSRLEPANRLDLLVEALPRLAQQYPAVQVVVIGKGDAERERLTHLARQAGVEQHLRLQGAIYGEEQLAPWFLAADLFCYPANIGLSILHAFGYGLPVVTSDRTESQNPEIEAMQDGQNGLLYRDGDAAHLAEQITRLLADDGLRRKLADEARRTATQRFSLDNMVEGMEAAVRGTTPCHQPATGARCNNS